MSTATDYILWLPSWYPNRFDPFNGDFIQRHAIATALYENITVIHFAAPGEHIEVVAPEVVTKQSGKLKEVIVYKQHRPKRIAILNKIVYNVDFYNHARRFLLDYFKQHGLPKKVHVHVPVKAGNLALWIKKKFGIDYIVSEHASYYMPEAEDSYFERHRLYKRQVTKVFQKAIVVTNVSAAIGGILQRIFRLKEVVVIHNTVNTNYFNYSNQKHPVFTFLHVSTLIEQKNIMGILKTFEQLLAIRQDWQLQLVGPASESLRTYIQQRGLQSHIELIGEIPYEQVAGYMKKAHVLVMFSRHENFPCVIVEALCCGLPIIGTQVAGIGEAVNASNGILVASEDEKALFQALLRIQEDYSVYDRVTISREAISRYSYQTIGRQIFNVYYAAPPYAG